MKTAEQEDLTMDLTVTASGARATDTGAEGRHGPGVDVDVIVTLGGRTLAGEVTLLPADDGSPQYVAWGSPDHWVSPALLALLYAAYEGDRAGLRDALTEIGSIASDSAGRVQS
jgi:hypothetical protein